MKVMDIVKEASGTHILIDRGGGIWTEVQDTTEHSQNLQLRLKHLIECINQPLLVPVKNSTLEEAVISESTRFDPGRSPMSSAFVRP